MKKLPLLAAMSGAPRAAAPALAAAPTPEDARLPAFFDPPPLENEALPLDVHE